MGNVRLENDPHEMNNLYGKLAYAERQEELHHLLDSLRAYYKDQ